MKESITADKLFVVQEPSNQFIANKRGRAINSRRFILTAGFPKE